MQRLLWLANLIVAKISAQQGLNSQLGADLTVVLNYNNLNIWTQGYRIGNFNTLVFIFFAS